MNWVLFWGSRFVPPFVWLSAVRLVVLGNLNHAETCLGPNLSRIHFSLSLLACPQIRLSEVAADYSRLRKLQRTRGRRATDAERVEQSVPQPVEVATEGSRLLGRLF